MDCRLTLSYHLLQLPLSWNGSYVSLQLRSTAFSPHKSPSDQDVGPNTKHRPSVDAILIHASIDSCLDRFTPPAVKKVGWIRCDYWLYIGILIVSCILLSPPKHEVGRVGPCGVFWAVVLHADRATTTTSRGLAHSWPAHPQ